MLNLNSFLFYELHTYFYLLKLLVLLSTLDISNCQGTNEFVPNMGGWDRLFCSRHWEFDLLSIRVIEIRLYLMMLSYCIIIVNNLGLGIYILIILTVSMGHVSGWYLLIGFYCDNENCLIVLVVNSQHHPL